MTIFNIKSSRAKSGIVGKLILYILLISTFLTLVGTGLQLHLDFNRDLKSIYTTFDQIESSHLSAIISSLWVTDNELLQMQLEGILQMPDMQLIEILDGTEILHSAGTPRLESIIEKTIPLNYMYNGKNLHLGNLRIVASMKGVYERITDRFLVILSYQTISIFLLSIFIFFFFYQLVGRHIIALASYTDTIKINSKYHAFKLKRKAKAKKPDELERLVDSFNKMRKNLAEELKLREIAREELRVSKARYQKLYDSAPEMYVSVSPEDASILMCNQTLLNSTGYAREEIIGAPIFKLYHQDCMEEVKKTFKLFKDTGAIKDKELILKRKDNSRIFVSLNVESVRDDAGKIIHSASSWRDISARKIMENELREYRENLEELVKARTGELEDKTKTLENSRKSLALLMADVNKSREELGESNKELEAFSYSVSHDLRAPLRAIGGFTRILMEDYSANLDDEGRELGGFILQNTQKMAQLIDDLLAFSRMSRASLSISEIDMQSMALKVYNEITTPEERERIEFSAMDLPKIAGDSKMMYQVWQNLIANAVKFSSIREQAIISISCQEDDNEFVFCVKDNGTGFDMKYVDKLFGVFQRLHSEQEFAGTGVGLSLVKRIIKRYEGDVRAEGENNVGAAFYFTLPKRKVLSD
jgi:PAS domain S-box-containing protein